MGTAGRGTKRILGVLPLVPRVVRALWGLARDRRLGLADRLLALLAVAYVLSPVDLIPDVVAVLGWGDDLFLAGLLLTRLLGLVAGPVLAEHWPGGRRGLVRDARRLRRVGVAVPGPVRKLLRRVAVRRMRSRSG